MQSAAVQKMNFMPQKWFSRSNIITFLLFSGLVVLYFSPESKAWVMQQMMKAGFFQPDTENITLSARESVPPQLVFQDGSGKKTDLSQHTGKVIFINFWATWCPPCIAELPSINRLYESYKGNDKIMFLMVDVDSNHPQAQKFMDKKHFGLPVYIPAGPIPSNMLGNSIPCTIVLDKAGKMAFRHEGGAEYDSRKFKQAIQNLLNE
jgi:thiol-disulfide isomerase/thioredoxin